MDGKGRLQRHANLFNRVVIIIKECCIYNKGETDYRCLI